MRPGRARSHAIVMDSLDHEPPPDLPFVPPPEAEAEQPATLLTAAALEAHVARVGTIEVEEALLLGVPAVALQPSLADAEHQPDPLPVGDRLRVEKGLKQMQQRAAQAAEVRELVARASAIKADGNERFQRADIGAAVERYETALQLLQRPRETDVSSEEGDDLPAVPPREAEGEGEGGTAAAAELPAPPTACAGELDPDQLIEGLASLLRAGGEAADVDQAKELAVTVCVNLAQCAIRQGRPADAVRACDAALQLDERRGKAWFRRGQARAALGLHADATTDLTRAAVLLPNSREVREALEQSTAAALPAVPQGIVV